ncbi:ABC transporter substrate-binding protein [Nocardia lasii]|uniref:ABC transporter substrate-binding protein n=1 Tax=Nocardia lasii TaxID=1616107 RepID=A0ABW1JWZ7_9NOCA
MAMLMDRRGFFGLAAGAVGAVALAGCAGSAETAVASTRAVEGATGPVQIPVNPARVVCLDHYTPGALLDVGYTPVAMAEYDETQLLATHLDAYRAIPKVGPRNGAKPELVLTHTPDLILSTALSHAPDTNAARFAEIAPTVYFPARQAGEWKLHALSAADTVGKRAEGDEVKRRYDERANDIATRYQDVFARTRWSMVMGGRNPATWYLALPDSWSGVVLADAGVQFSDISQGTGTTKEFSIELIDTLTPSDVILYQADNTGAPLPTTNPLRATEAWTRLPAVRTGHAYPLSYFNTLHYGQAMSVLDRIEEIAKTL